MISRDHIAAALKCLGLKMPFVILALPGDDQTRFFANPSYGHDRQQEGEMFVIVPWLAGYEQRYTVSNELSAADVIDGEFVAQNHEDARPWSESTSQTDYIRTVSALIDRLKVRGGKTVFSRSICGSSERFNIGKFVESQFESFPSTFRYLYYTPETGAWLGTSPEILLDLSVIDGSFKIMSLAGTRKVSDLTRWDNKNIAEQGLVADYISRLLRELGIPFSLNRCRDVVFEPVCHICDIFSGRMDQKRYPELLDRLSPTPALGGYPREDAIKDITDFETHPRRCYGGYVGLVTGERITTYVNLRNINFDEHSWCIYAGGGITAASNPGDEWNETMNKTEILRRNLKNATT